MGAQYSALATSLVAIIVRRRVDAVTTSQFWAEDGSIHFGENLTLGFVGAFLHLYRGYPNLAQRLIAAVGGWVPFASAPRFYTTRAAARASCSGISCAPEAASISGSTSMGISSCATVDGEFRRGSSICSKIGSRRSTTSS
jgi:hypothetical protein